MWPFGNAPFGYIVLALSLSLSLSVLCAVPAMDLFRNCSAPSIGKAENILDGIVNENFTGDYVCIAVANEGGTKLRRVEQPWGGVTRGFYSGQFW